MIYFLNVSAPDSGIYNATRRYYDYFNINNIPAEWINLHWDKSIRFEGKTIEFRHFFGSGFTINNIINYLNPSYGIKDIKIYTDYRMMPVKDGKEIMIIHDLFKPLPYINRIKQKKVLKILKYNKIGVITNSKYTALRSKNEGLRVLTELYPYYSYTYDKGTQKRNMIISVGTNGYRKRPDLILKFINDLPEDWTFVRIGGDLSHIGNINTKAKYIYKDKVTAEELISYYNQSKYLFFPSEYEGLGLPIIEALHHNVVVIANYKNPVLEEFNFTNLISKQKEGDFHIPEYDREDEFNIFREWYRTQIKNQFRLILEEIEKINDLQL